MTEDRLAALPRVCTWSARAGLVIEAPTGIAYAYSPSRPDEPLPWGTWEGFFIPVNCWPGIADAVAGEGMLEHVNYVGSDLAGKSPHFDPSRQAQVPKLIPVTTDFGKGWFFWRGDHRTLPERDDGSFVVYDQADEPVTGKVLPFPVVRE